jgi:excisionase family DNA binding protein
VSHSPNALKYSFVRENLFKLISICLHIHNHFDRRVKLRLINTSEAAEILGVTPQTITSLCRSGMIDTAFFVGGRWLIYWSDFLGANIPKIGRPAGSRNRKPYPKGVKRPRKHLASRQTCL